MTSGIDARETRRVEEIQASIGRMETRFEPIYAERVEMKERVNITKVEPSENLMRRRDDISARIEAVQAASDTPESAGRGQELKSCEARLDVIAKRIDSSRVLANE
jgi:hypothetical protein